MKELILWVYVLVPTPQCVDQWKARQDTLFVQAGSTSTVLRLGDLRPEPQPNEIVAESKAPPVVFLKDAKVPGGIGCYEVGIGKKVIKLSRHTPIKPKENKTSKEEK